MCEHFQLDNGTLAIICGGRVQRKFCQCGREAKFVCDWKVSSRTSGTCDRPLCVSHSKQVAPLKHLCQEHQRLYGEWKRNHPPQQGTLFEETT
jgi:hypothetical protein